MTPVFEAQEVTARTADTTLVEGVSLAVNKGAMLGVVGETGAGKTITMRAIMGILPAGVRAHGRLILDGEARDLSHASDVQRLLGSQMTVVLQNPLSMLDPLMRVGDQLIEGVVRKRLMGTRPATARASSLLRDMGFAKPESVLRMHPHQLSGGMAQRVVIAMGMMPNPRLLVVDEPTSALDANVRVEVLKIVRRLAQENGTAVIMVSHDLGLVSHFCESVAVFYAGRVVEQNATAELVRAPAHPYTRALLDASATVSSMPRTPLRVIAGTPPSPGAWPRGCRFSPRCPHARERCTDVPPELAEHNRSLAACHYPLGAKE